MMPRILRAPLAAAFFALVSLPALATGNVGEHVQDLEAHLDHYNMEILEILGTVSGLVDRYRRDGELANAQSALVDQWEAVDFHAAIETNYIRVYAMIWQGLYGVGSSIENAASLADVEAAVETLEIALWQGLGAVKMASLVQKNGGLVVAASSGDDASPTSTLAIIKQELDRVVAKYAEQVPEEAVDIVHETYLTRFEGIEGQLIEQNAELVEDLELDFNVTLPRAIQAGGPVDDVRTVVRLMQEKLDTAAALLEAAEQARSKVF